MTKNLFFAAMLTARDHPIDLGPILRERESRIDLKGETK